MDKPLRVLILEDNPADAEIILFELEEAGIVPAAKVVTKEEDYIRELQAFCPDIILSDYDLPRYNGASALAEARTRCPDVPVILVTGAVSEDRAIETLTSGAKDYVMKTRLSRLVPAVRRVLAEAEEQRARRQAEQELREAHDELESRVRERTADLEAKIEELTRTQRALRESEERAMEHAEQLRQSEARLQLTLQASAVGTFEIDLTTGAGRWNAVEYELLGLKPGDAPASPETFFRYVHPGDVAELTARWEEATQTGRLDEEFRVIRTDGQERWLAGKGQFAFAETPEAQSTGGKRSPLRFLGVNFDITERKRAEEERERLLGEVEAERDRISALVDSMRDEVWFADTQKRFTLANPAALKEFGLDKYDAVDVEKFVASLEVLRPDGSPRPIEEAQPLRALKGEVVTNEEEIVRTPATGELRYRQVNAAPVRDRAGRIIGAVSVVRDITARKKAQEALRRSQETLSELIERSPFGTYIVDSQFRIAMMNSGSQDGAFRNVRPVVGRDFSEAMRILWPEPVAAEIIGHFRHTLETGEPYYSPQFINPRHDMEIVESYEWELHRMTLPHGQYGVICYYYDSTKLREAEAAVRVSGESLRSLAENVPCILMRFDRQLRVVYLSKQSDRYNPNPVERMIGRTDREMGMPQHLRDLWDAAIGRVFRTGTQEEMEFDLAGPSGARTFALRFAPEFGPDHEVRYVLGVSSDITDRKRAEEALRESEERYRTLFNSMTEGFALHEIITDEQGRPVDYRFLDVNPAFEELTGLKRADLLGKRVLEALPGTEAHWIENYGRVALTGEPVRFENYSSALDRWYEVFAYQPAPRQFAVVFTDITTGKRVEEREQREYRETEFANRVLRAFVELEGNALFDQALAVVLEETASRHGVFGYIAQPGHLICPSLSKMLDACEVKGKCIHYPPEKWKGLWARALTEKRALFTNDAPPVPPGHPIIHNNLAMPILFRGEVIGLLNIANKDGGYTDADRDTLDRIATRIAPVLYAWIQRKQREDEREAAEEALRKAKDELEAFSYSASHDLRAPLRAIDGYARMILKKQEDKFDEETKRQFTQIRDGVRAMGQLIEDLLALSRLARQDLNVGILDMCKLIEKTWQELQKANPDRTMTLKMNRPLPPGLGDEGLILQVIVNILTNAVKFTKRRDAALIEAGGYDRDNEIIYYVKDNGVGFDMQYHDKLFGVFQRLHSADEYEGTGIGMALVQRIIQRHGGRVWAEGELDKGATFYFALPKRHE